MSETLASFRCSAGKIKNMLVETALKEGDDPFHDDIYLRVYDERVEAVVATKNNSVLSNCTFFSTYFDGLDTHIDRPVGAVVPVEQTINYLELADEGGTVEWMLMGEVDDGESEDDDDDDDGDSEDVLAMFLQMEGALNTLFKLPTAQEVVDQVPMSLPERFDGNDMFHSADGNTHDTVVETNIRELKRIHQAVQLDEEVDFFPVTVKDGEFSLELGTSEDGQHDRTAVWGGLSGSQVDGEDLQNWYNTGFDEVVKTLSGDIQIQATQDAPMALVQNSEKGKTIRHVLVNVNIP